MDINSINSNIISDLKTNETIKPGEVSLQKVNTKANNNIEFKNNEYYTQSNYFAQNIQSLNDGIATSNIVMNSVGKQQEYLSNIQEKLLDIQNLNDKEELKKSINNDLVAFNQLAFNTKYKSETLLINKNDDDNLVSVNTSSDNFSTEKPNTSQFANSIFNAVNNNDLNSQDNIDNAKNIVSSSNEQLQHIYNRFNDFSTQLKDAAKQDIVKQNEIYSKKYNENINIGKEAVDFSQANINTNAGYLASTQANIVQSQSIRLLT